MSVPSDDNVFGSLHPNFDHFRDRDLAGVVLRELDYEAQMVAVRGLLERNAEVEARVAAEIEGLVAEAKQAKGLRNDVLVEDSIERMQMSVYQDAAHSMAAVGMLAPLLESIFVHAFTGIREKLAEIGDTSLNSTNHARWRASDDDRWDCHFVWSEKGARTKDVAAGIEQLAGIIGLTHRLPKDVFLTLQALFAYRNKMFHGGFEWPVAERSRFATRLASAGWPSGWFTQATSGGKPWVFYMTPDFIAHCATTTDAVVDAIGGYVRDVLLPKPPGPDAQAQ